MMYTYKLSSKVTFFIQVAIDIIDQNENGGV